MKENKIRIPIQTIPIEDDGCHLTVLVTIGEMHAVMLIDTGASRTVFDINRIRNFTGDQDFVPNEKLSTGLGTSTMETHSTDITCFKLGELVIDSLKIILLDLSNVNETYLKLGLPEIDGVLGSDLLHQYQAIIDYGRNELILR